MKNVVECRMNIIDVI